jgi:hypothetical protein
MWWFWFTDFHMSVCFLLCLFGLGCFLLADGVWQTSFLPQELHTSMLKPPSCACETARRLKISPQESNKKQKQSQTSYLQSIHKLTFLCTCIFNYSVFRFSFVFWLGLTKKGQIQKTFF